MSNNDFMELAKEVVVHYHNSHLNEGEAAITEDKVVIAWMHVTPVHQTAILRVKAWAESERRYKFEWDDVGGDGNLEAYAMQEHIKVEKESEEN